MKTFVPGKTYIPPSGQEITEDDKAILIDVAMSGWYTENRCCAGFRKNLGLCLSKKNVRLVNSGSSASLVAISAMTEYVNRDFDYVVTTATGFPTTVSPIYQCGKIPIYIDINPKTLTPDISQLERVIATYKDKIGFMVFAHTMGFPFREEDVTFQIKGIQIPLIADCCDALGAEYYSEYLDCWVSVGREASLGTLSFFPAHHITTGEGGAVFTNNDELDELCRSFSEWGRSCYCLPGQQNTCSHRFDWEDRGGLPEGFDHKYIFDRLGYNLKMTEFQAALGVSQLSRLDEFVDKRRFNYAFLRDGLVEYEEHLDFVVTLGWSKPSPFGFPIMVKETAPFTVSDITQYLEAHKVGTRRMFGGNLTKQPGFAKLPFYSMDLHGSDRIMNTMFWIGVQPALGQPELDYVLEQFDGFFKERGL